MRFTFGKKVVLFFWRIIMPFFLTTRDALIALHIIHHRRGRQSYHVGWLAPGRTLEGLKAHLATLGFEHDLIAWVDETEHFCMRRQENYDYQYHIRVFFDNEIRGHYEQRPESHPLAHFKEWGMEPRREEFLNFLGGWVVQREEGNTSSQSAPAASRGVPKSG